MVVRATPELAALTPSLASNPPGTMTDMGFLNNDAAMASCAGMRRTLTLGVVVDAFDSLAEVVEIMRKQIRLPARARRQAFLVTFVNPAAVVAAERNAWFGAALQDFDLVMPDGIAMAMAAKYFSGCNTARVSFDTTSLAPPVLHLANDYGSRIALVGGKEGVAQHAAEQIRERFPQLHILGTWHGYGDMAALVAEVHAAEPDIVICGMGSGAQEEFLLRLRARGWHGIGFTCGGYLDQTAGGLDYYPAWIDKANLRWLYRLAREPRRLWRRYLLDYGHFAFRFGTAAMDRLRPGLANRGAG